MLKIFSLFNLNLKWEHRSHLFFRSKHQSESSKTNPICNLYYRSGLFYLRVDLHGLINWLSLKDHKNSFCLKVNLVDFFPLLKKKVNFLDWYFKQTTSISTLKVCLCLLHWNRWKAEVMSLLFSISAHKLRRKNSHVFLLH